MSPAVVERACGLEVTEREAVLILLFEDLGGKDGGCLKAIKASPDQWKKIRQHGRRLATAARRAILAECNQIIKSK